MKKGLVCVTALAALSVMAFGQAPTINQRQENQQARIDQGIKSGELTRGEANRLEAQQGRIEANKLVDKAKDGGKLTAKNRAQLTREQNRASANIYHLKHNGRTR
jgi:hypothetical protein